MSELKVRVGFKEQHDPIPLCYCFDYTRADITRELSLNGKTHIPHMLRSFRWFFNQGDLSGSK